MRVAIVSDIHGNRHAFEAVLDAIEASDCQEMWCLGDLVGYGAEPDACVELARRYAAICLAGNHDLGVRGALPLEEFSRGAALAARWTQGVITPRDPRVPGQARARPPRGARRPVPRQPPGSDLGVRALAAPGRAVPRRSDAPRLPDRALARRAVVLPRRRRIGHRADPGRRRAARSDRGRVADQPRQRRTAPRRRPPRAAGSSSISRAGSASTAAPSTTSRGPPRRSARPACRTRSPSGSRTASRRLRASKHVAAIRPLNGQRPSKVRPRMRYAPRAILAGGLGFAVSFLAACGGSAGLLSGDQSIALSGQGNRPDLRGASGNCGAAVNASAALNDDVQKLPITVNPTLRENLTQGAVHDLPARREGMPPARPTTTSTPTTTSSSSTSTSTTTTTTPTTTTSDDHDHDDDDDHDRNHAAPTRVLLLRQAVAWGSAAPPLHQAGTGTSGGTGPGMATAAETDGQ